MLHRSHFADLLRQRARLTREAAEIDEQIADAVESDDIERAPMDASEYRKPTRLRRGRASGFARYQAPTIEPTDMDRMRARKMLAKRGIGS